MWYSTLYSADSKYLSSDKCIQVHNTMKLKRKYFALVISSIKLCIAIAEHVMKEE